MPLGASRVKLPLASVTVPFFPEASTTLAPIMGSPFSSRTIPFTVTFACSTDRNAFTSGEAAKASPPVDIQSKPIAKATDDLVALFSGSKLGFMFKYFKLDIMLFAPPKFLKFNKTVLLHVCHILRSFKLRLQRIFAFDCNIK